MKETMEFFSSLNTWVVNNIDFPAVVLLLVFMMGAYVLYRTQANKSNGFDFADMLRDESGKPSAFRLGIFVSMSISSWAIMYILIHNKGVIDTWQLLGYLGIWSGAKIVEKAIDAWAQRGQPITTTQTTRSTDGQGGSVTQQLSQVIPTSTITAAPVIPVNPPTEQQ